MKCIKRFLFLLVLCSCFLFYKNTYAMGINVKPYWINAYSRSTSVISGNQIDGWELDNYPYYTFYTTSSLTRTMYIYSKPNSFDSSKYYDVNFMIYQPNVLGASVNDYSATGTPIVLFNGYQCTTKYASSYLRTGVSNLSTFSVNCRNVNVNGDFNISVFTANVSGDLSLSDNYRYGISQVWSYSELSSSSDLKSSIDQNTEETKKQTEEVKKQTEQQEKMNENITSEDSPDTDSFFNDLQVDDSNSPVSDLMIMPLTLLNSYTNGFSGTCQAYNLGNLYGHDLVLPCVSIEKYVGSNLWSLIDTIFTLYMVYNIGMLCISIYESITELDDGMQLLYTPQHSGHTRVSRNEDLY